MANMEIEQQQDKSQPKQPSFSSAMKQCVELVEKAVTQLDKKYASRALRGLPYLRKQITLEKLQQAVSAYVQNEEVSSVLSSTVQTAAASMDVDNSQHTTQRAAAEASMFVALVALVFLIDSGKKSESLALSQKLVNLVPSLNRRMLDPIAAQIFFYYARAVELFGQPETVRNVLLAAQRFAVLRHDEHCEAMLINLILRNYLHYNLYDQAEKFAEKSQFPEKAQNAESSRYMFYMGKIKTIGLKYSEGRDYLLQAIRKAPSGILLDKVADAEKYAQSAVKSKGSIGFLQTAYKFYVTVQLLMGEIPNRADFRVPILKQCLEPYYHLTMSMRSGDLSGFQNALSKYGQQLQKDGTLSLVQRLRHNVIKTGIRIISLSYSKISLRDICMKLSLDSEEDAEYIVAKAINDGVIDATINHQKGYVQNKENSNIYCTTEPQEAFNQRIQFCLNLHQETVKALRYDSEKNKKKEIDEEKANEQAVLEAELAELDEGDFDDEDDDMGF
ncbi:hypothetical protein MP228_000653 [Amoeboaphelidium protococcarum]|nr:hypothetical protein MP228_000653 [Amoeboaphelidium protococcarum]